MTLHDPALDPGQRDEAQAYLAEPVCLCAFCRQMIYEADAKADHPVYKLGELAYIELAHAQCAEADRSGSFGWQYA